MPIHPHLTLREAIVPLPGKQIQVSVEALATGGHRLFLLDDAVPGQTLRHIAPFPDPSLEPPLPGLAFAGIAQAVAAMNAWALAFLPRLGQASINLTVHAGTRGRRRKAPPPLPPPLDALLRGLIQAKGACWPAGGLICVSIDAGAGTDARPGVRIGTVDADGRLHGMVAEDAPLIQEVRHAVLPWWRLASPWLSAASDIAIGLSVPEPSAHERMAALASLARRPD